MYTTLNKIRQHSLRSNGWKKLLHTLGKTEADDEPLPLLTILNSNGLDDAMWCLRAVDGHDREIRLYAVWCARQVEHLMTDERSINAMNVAERFANGEATQDELTDAASAASAVASAALSAAWDASAALAAAWAAGDASAAWTASGDAGDASAAWTAAWAARALQEKELRRILKSLEETKLLNIAIVSSRKRRP